MDVLLTYKWITYFDTLINTLIGNVVKQWCPGIKLHIKKTKRFLLLITYAYGVLHIILLAFLNTSRYMELE